MTYEQIHNLFKQRYNQSNWKQFLSDAFSTTRLFTTPETLTGIDTNVALKVVKLGYIQLNENGIERHIAAYEVTLAQGIILERNRVGLRNLLRKYWKNIDAAFIAYHRPETPNWRFTYVSELTGYDAEGEFVKIKTEPKRYTYVLGEGESTRTAAERFTAIANKGSMATLDDVKEAFSVEKLSKAFFDEYKKHYDIFCDFMVKKPSIRQTIFNGDEKSIRDFNKKLLGRIVFLYFIQKKGWLGVPAKSDWGKGDFDFLTTQFNQSKNPELFYQEFLSPLFFETLNKDRMNSNDIVSFIKEPCRIPYLNGGLFEEDDKKHRNLIFTANLFKKLFEFFNQYNFTIYEDDPDDQTIAVDPEMLGHIFENLLEDNKDKGAYYTPKEIVHYMCQESLIEYLTTWFENKGYEVKGYIGFDKPDQLNMFSANESRKGQMILETESRSKGKNIDRILIEKLLKKKLDEEDKKLIKKHSVEIHAALDTVKICDPAIGSGAFPMGLLHEIFTAKQTLHTFEHGNTKTFDASVVKLNIIQNSIYGVDIEKGAVDIARLRFWLSLIVDEEKPKALPNLDYKIVVGNSLVSKFGDDVIDIDWTLNETAHGLFGADLAKQKSDLLKKISKEQKDFFNPNNDKKKLAGDIRKLKIDFLIIQLELMVKITNQETEPKSISYKDKIKFVQATELYFKTIGWKSTIKDLQKLKLKPEQLLYFFDWKLDFPEVMNERVTEKTGFDIVIGNPPYVNIEKIDKSIKDNISKFKTAHQKYDLYVLFYEVALNLLKEKGVLSFITSNKFLSQGYGLKLRQEFLLYRIDQIINFNYDIFESATVRTCIIQLSKRTPNISHNIDVIDVNTITDKEKFSKRIIVEVPQNTFDDTVENNFRINLTKDKIKLLKKISKECHSLNEICSVNYGLRPSSEKLGLKKEAFIYETKTKSKFKPYFEGKDMGYWLVKNISYLDYQPKTMYNAMFPELFENEKLVGLRTLSDITKLRFIYDNQGYYCNDSVVVVTLWNKLKHVEYTTIKKTITKTNIAISKNYSYQYLQAILNSKLIKFYVNELMYDGTHFYPNHMKVLPIKILELKNQSKFIKLVDKLFSFILEYKEISSLEQQIDNLVYKVYELSYDEVKIIDPVFGLTKIEYEAIKSE